MATPITEVDARPHLLAAGFVEEPGFTSMPPSTFRLSFNLPWSISASVEDGATPPHLDLSLERIHQVGAIHRVTSVEALANSLQKIVADLKALAGTATLKCPKCGLLWITVKYGNGKPFLSCSGMQKGRGFKCDGKSKALKPIVVY